MTNKKPTNNELIIYRLDQVETKIDALGDKFDAMSSVPRGEFEAFKEHVETMYLKKESIKGAKAVLQSIAIAVGVAVIIGIFRLLGTRI